MPDRNPTGSFLLTNSSQLSALRCIEENETERGGGAT
jgi:hypothetical protein